MIRARDVHVQIGGNQILHGVSLDVDAGEAVAVMGGNGSGKTTFVRAIVGALPVASGTIEVFERPVKRSPRARVGYVPQRLSASSGVSATALEVVASGLLHGRQLWLPRDAKARATAALAAVGLPEIARQAVGTLSGGQQQRVLIARAMVRQPDLLVLDEPAAGVDLPSQEAFAAALGAAKEAGVTIVIVLHEVGLIGELLDRAVVLERGCVTYVGAPPQAHGVHALPGHDHVHPHGADPHPHPDAGPAADQLMLDLNPGGAR